MDRRLRNVIGYVVTVVWACSFLADIKLESYEPSPYVHFAMMIVVGAAFGPDVFKKNGNGEKKP